MIDKLFVEKTSDVVPVTLVLTDNLDSWMSSQNARVQNWVKSHLLPDPTGQDIAIPSESGAPERVIYISNILAELWDDASFVSRLSQGVYQLDESFDSQRAEQVFLASGLQQYRFEKYKKSERQFVQLVQRNDVDHTLIEDQLSAIYLVRDLITMPSNHMGPEELEDVAHRVAETDGAYVSVIRGSELLSENYPAIHTVGRASDRVPRLIDIKWGKLSDPKITLVGKGVCFDSGGLDLKPASGMLTMKKDMGGAAFVLGLAQLIMKRNIPVRLRVLIPAVENSISGNAYRPLDVIKMRSGKTVEVSNTDAEGRLILADAMFEADGEKPDLIIDCATLTGAARVAMGPDLPALFTNRDPLAKKLVDIGQELNDPFWHMPLWEPYRSSIKSKIADLTSTGKSPLGGAIIAALFLSEFLPENTPWLHIDMMAYNQGDRPGRPEGGEASGLRALYHFITQWKDIKSQTINSD